MDADDMKRRSFLGLLGGAVVAPFAKAAPIEETIVKTAEIGFDPSRSFVAGYYPPVFTPKLWAKALERDVIFGTADQLFKCELSEMSTIVINHPEPLLDA